jgi:hypothetical protein
VAQGEGLSSNPSTVKKKKKGKRKRDRKTYSRLYEAF